MKLKSNVITIVTALFACVAFVLLSVPAFNMTGLIIKPILLCVTGSLVISFLLCFISKGETACGLALLFFVVFWTIYAFAEELKLQLSYGFPGKWIEFFYFDKLLMVGTIWFSAVTFFVILRLFKKNSLKSYKCFFKTSSFAFVVFYTFLLLYSFVFIRLEQSVYPMNWVPFSTIKVYISDYSSIPYEVFMMFFGNLFYFTPLGIIFYLVLKKYNTIVFIIVTAVFPVVAFTLLEYSQYLFQNGFCEFDDMMMNSVGFWFGSVLGFMADVIVKKATKGRITCFWG